MKFIILFGPMAVGKMTVGQELEKVTGLKLFHNHMTIELLLPFFKMTSKSFKKLRNAYRIQFFEEVVKSDLEGIIFTYVWELDQKSDCDFVDKITNIFKKENAEVYYVELEAGFKERLKRNKSARRLKYKPSKKNILESDEELLDTDRKYRLNSNTNEFHEENYLQIDNTRINAAQTAKLIKEKFDL